MFESWIPSGKFNRRESGIRKVITLVSENMSVKHTFF